jgi:hypothetical protein
MCADRLLRRGEASEYLKNVWGIRRAPASLATYAHKGGGPVFVHIGTIPFYFTKDLDAWAKTKISPRKRSTSELAEEQRTDDGAARDLRADEQQEVRV